MADNYVSIRIKASDDAKPDLTDLKLKLDELSHKVATARAEVDDKQADAALAALDVKLQRIADKAVNPKIKMRGAEQALADLLAVDLAMDRLSRKADDLRVKADAEAAAGGLLRRMFLGKGRFSFENFFGNAVSGFMGLLQKIPFVPGGDAAAGAAEGGGGGGAGGLAGMGVAIGAIVNGLAAASTELTGLVSGFAAAGAGAGAFYLLAHPAISNLMGDYQKLSGAQAAYQQAQNKYNLDPTKANAKALATAAENLKAVNMSMSQDAGGAAGGLMKLRTEYDKLSAAFKPEAFKVINGVLKIANDLLPHIVPFANTFADAMSRLLGDAGKFANSSGFKDWLSQFQKLEGPSIGAIGVGIGHVVTSLGKLFTLMSAKDVVNSINIAFSVIDGAIIGLVGFVKGTMWVWDRLTTAWDWLERVARRTGHDIAAAWDAVRHAAAQLGHDIAVWFSRITGDIARWAGDAETYATRFVRWYTSLPGRIGNALAALPGMLFQVGVNAVQGLLRGAQSMIGGVLSTVGGWAHDIANAIGGVFGIHFSEPSEATQMVKAGRNVALGLAKGMTGGRSAVEQAARTLGGAGAAHGGYGSGGGHHLVIEIRGSDSKFMTALMNEVRVSGGDPAMFNRKVAFR